MKKLAILLTVLVLVAGIMPSVAAADDICSVDEIKAVYARVNEKYGTNIRLADFEKCPTMTKSELIEFENELIHIALYDVPKIEATTKYADMKMAENGMKNNTWYYVTDITEAPTELRDAMIKIENARVETEEAGYGSAADRE